MGKAGEVKEEQATQRRKTGKSKPSKGEKEEVTPRISEGYRSKDRKDNTESVVGSVTKRQFKKIVR